MKKWWKNSRQLIQRLGYRLPVTWYFVVFAILALLAFEWLRGMQRMPDTSFSDIFLLLIRVAVFFILTLVALALLSVLTAWVYVWVQRRKQHLTLQLDSAAPVKRKQLQLLHLKLHPVIPPFLGFIKLRLRYDGDRFSEKFSIVKDRSQTFFSTTLQGTYHWELPSIKEYTIEQAVLYFEDFFQFFSFTIQLPTSNHFITQPQQLETKVLTASPRKTEETNTRIDELKKVEGEYLHYKNFENHDDVRRIVWKIYARNKELVVRTPEVLDPYASHIYLYASFYTHFDITGNEVVNIPFLNYYKTAIWNAYRELEQQGLEVRYVPDQPIAVKASAAGPQLVKYGISTSAWQTDITLAGYVKPAETAILFVSSLSDEQEVSKLVEQHGNDMVIVFVALSKSLQKQHLGDWLKWLFVKNEEDAVARYKTAWSLSLLRGRLLANEKKLTRLLEKYQKPVLF